MTMLHRMAELSAAGLSRDEIAQELGVGREWVDWVMDTDGFKVIEDRPEPYSGER
jgi:orotate phosphoribosyltransferase-like protein